MFLGALSGSAIIDKFSMWLLAGTGATAALMITNLDKIVPFLGVAGLKTSLSILIISALCGFIAKYKALNCQILQEVRKEIEKRVKPVMEKHETDEEKILKMAEEHRLEVETEIDVNIISSEYCKAFPEIIHKKLIKGFSEGLEDSLAPSRKAVRNLFWQGNLTILQFVMFILFVFITMINIKNI